MYILIMRIASLSSALLSNNNVVENSMWLQSTTPHLGSLFSC